MFDQITKFANDATTSVTDAVNDAKLGEQFTNASDQVLDTVLDVNRRVVDFAVTTADRVNEQVRGQVDVELPFADSFPTPTIAGERYLEFVERAVSINRDVNQRIAEMITVDNAQAAARKVADTATGATRTSTKTVAEKAPARKAPAKKAAARKAPAKKAAAKKPTTSK